MLEEKELRVLGDLGTSKTRQELASELGYAPKTVTNALRALEEHELVRRERNAQRTVVHPTDARCIESYRALTSANRHVDVPELLTSSMLTLLYYLNSSTAKSAATLVQESGLARSTVYRLLNTLTKRAIVVKDHSQYRLVDEFAGLHEFSTQLRHHLHLVKVRNDLGGGSLVWESYHEFLVRTDSRTDLPEYNESGIDAFAQYGLEFFTTAEHYYFYSEIRDALSVADLVCHALLIENDSRHRKYALLLIAAADEPPDAVRTAGRKYELEDVIDPIVDYFESRGAQSSPVTPQWEELESLATDYGVSL